MFVFSFFSELLEGLFRRIQVASTREGGPRGSEGAHLRHLRQGVRQGRQALPARAGSCHKVRPAGGMGADSGVVIIQKLFSNRFNLISR